MRYLLDTNIISVLVSQPDGTLAERVSAFEDDEICTSIVVVAEVRYGVTKRGSQRLARQVEEILDSIWILPLEHPVDHVYARLRVQLESTGQPIGPNDLLIDSQALAYDLTLVTDNVREFSRVEDLRIENWLRDDDPMS